MDKTDIGIIKCLTKNARMNASQIGEKVGLSVSAIIERMKKLEASGLIHQYTAVLDEKLAGFDTQALISIRLEHPKYNESFSRCMREHPAVTDCYYLTGDFDYMARVVTESTEDLTKVLNDIKVMPGVSLTRTFVILENVKHRGQAIPDEKQ